MEYNCMTVCISAAVTGRWSNVLREEYAIVMAVFAMSKKNSSKLYV